ncbi:hypothetical protein K504DRAFT_467973 [Pleomassaria siparia CBS 279.74]|uniref:Fungal N-terminal domain-containing protein n=1 Tax=Pleomassaria siparia CBS 279.74 TaxID=1314801 RepID=A0A6G1K8H6_9PLEO|nr:hypothetical protein K504DRAFT_467973 [Pleomassaria siparia CBS 279.74]
MDPFSIFFGTLNGMFTFANFALRVNEVGSEHAVFVRTIQVVRNDLAETERLLSIKPIQVKLISTPSKLEWIKGAVYSTKSAMNDIGKWVERARVDQQTLGKVSFNSKLRWVFNDHEKLVNRKTELSACHQQLSNVLGFLITLEEPSVSSNPPTYHATTFFEDTVSPRQQGASHISESREVSLDCTRFPLRLARSRVGV